MMLKKFPELLEDSKKILQLQTTPQEAVQGHFYYGVAMNELGYYDLGIESLQEGILL